MAAAPAPAGGLSVSSSWSHSDESHRVTAVACALAATAPPLRMDDASVMGARSPLSRDAAGASVAGPMPPPSLLSSRSHRDARLAIDAERAPAACTGGERVVVKKEVLDVWSMPSPPPPPPATLAADAVDAVRPARPRPRICSGDPRGSPPDDGSPLEAPDERGERVTPASRPTARRPPCEPSAEAATAPPNRDVAAAGKTARRVSAQRRAFAASGVWLAASDAAAVAAVCAAADGTPNTRGSPRPYRS